VLEVVGDATSAQDFLADMLKKHPEADWQIRRFDARAYYERDPQNGGFFGL
jgi:hypothetical protein